MAGCPTGFETMQSVERDMVPIGGIIQWSGSIANIPDHYQICDGSNGTPDLRNKFVLGAGDTYAVNDSGGSNSPLVNIESGNPSGDINPQFGAGLKATLDEPLPPYLALAYIQRIN